MRILSPGGKCSEGGKKREKTLLFFMCVAGKDRRDKDVTKRLEFVQERKEMCEKLGFRGTEATKVYRSTR